MIRTVIDVTQAQRVMKAGFTRRSQRPWRSALAGALLPLALAAAARTNQYEQPGGQAPLHGQIAYPTASATTAAATPAPDDVAVFEQMADHMTIGQRVPGLAMAIVQNGRILSARGYGVTDVVAPQAVDAHTVFRLASLSKAFAGTVTGLLVNDGTLRWDTPVSDYVPDFHLVNEDATARLRVADVLSHRVGLRAHNAFDRDIEANASYQAVSGKLASVPLECLPGQCYAYQNVAFSLIGDVIASATGSSYEQEVRQRVFQPLGMKDASLGLDGILASAQWAKPHVRGRNGWVSQKPKPTYYRLPPAAGVNASISDMAQWLLAHTGHRPDVLPAPLLATLHAPLIATPGEIRGGWRRTRLSSAGYGLGWRAFDYAGHPVVFHAGAVSGYRGLVALLPEQDTGIALLWNSESNLPSGLLPTFLDHALGLQPGQWLDSDLPGREELLMAVRPSGPAASPTTIPAESLAPGSSPQRAAASPE